MPSKLSRHKKTFLKRYKKLSGSRFVFVAAFAFIGVVFITFAKGAVHTYSIEPEDTSLQGNVYVGHNDHAGSSNEHYITFGSAPPVASDGSLESFATGLSKPLEIVNTGVAGDYRLFVAEQNGRIKIVNAQGQVSSTPYLDISSRISTGGERGLLGVAFHPNYQSNGYFYVYYTASDGALTISRFVRSGDNTANPNSELKLLSIPHSNYSNHNGGGLRFSPADGYLYITTGDGGGGGDPLKTGQNLSSLLGKILRIDVNNGTPFSIPGDNPFVGKTGRDEIWAYGLRNPWRISFDRTNGDMFVADVGQNQWEEINFQSASSSGGQNYGWSCYEGNHNYNTSGCPPLSSTARPVYEYDHSQGRCSITGGYRYRGKQYTDMVGHYVFADYCSGHLYKMATDSSGNWKLVSQNQYSGLFLSGFGEDVDGELYAASLNSGTIYKVKTSH